MSNLLTLADSINAAYDTGKNPTFLYDGTLYTFSPTGLLAFIHSESAPLEYILTQISADVTITLEASETTDGMDVTIQVVDILGTNAPGANVLEIYISDDPNGLDLTSNDADAEITVTAGEILKVYTAEKHWSVVTDTNGIFSFTLVDTQNPAAIYVACKKPLGACVTVSTASGTNWEGAA